MKPAAQADSGGAVKQDNRALASAPAWRRRWRATAAALGLLVLVTARAAPAADQAREPRFKYVGGTEDVLPGCTGTLQVTAEGLAFKCAQYTVDVPYDSIEIMQFRADVSRRIRKMKLNWRVEPPYGGGSKNRYFAVVYKKSGARYAIVLQVPSDEMRPYLAEIDLKAGRRVDVQRHEDYE
ncbi:MAG TPA: hypothetical protein VL523_18940 [Terriglobia bacterium]|nr:hypothetical protein [Terriglobia bacterium]